MDPRKLSLTDAVIHGDTEAVRALLAAGSDVNETANGGRTPLILAILFRRNQIMTLLLEAGADPHQRDSLGLNAIDWAERKGLNLFNQRQGGKQEIPPATSSKDPMPFGGFPPSQSEKERTPASGASTQPVSDDEKSRRWIAGIKRRIDEEASHKIKKVEPTPPPTTAPDDVATLQPPLSPAVGATPLFDDNQPLFASFTSPQKTWMPLVWLLVVLVFSVIVGAAVTYFIILH